MKAHSVWTRDQSLAVFRLYCRTPFGKLHRLNPDIIQLAKIIGRTPDATAMKACNFASLDPQQKARGIKALGNVSQRDRQLWADFLENPEAFAADAETAYIHLQGQDTATMTKEEEELAMPDGPTEGTRLTRTRRVQAFFRAAVLTGYEYRCALSGIAVPELLNASHIIPWKDNVNRRADPRNGIALNALYDRAFDRGLISFDETCRVIVSNRLKANDPPIFQRRVLLELEGCPLRIPCRFVPDPVALAYHRESVFHPD